MCIFFCCPITSQIPWKQGKATDWCQKQVVTLQASVTPSFSSFRFSQVTTGSCKDVWEYSPQPCNYRELRNSLTWGERTYVESKLNAIFSELNANYWCSCSPTKDIWIFVLLRSFSWTFVPCSLQSYLHTICIDDPCHTEFLGSCHFLSACN